MNKKISIVVPVYNEVNSVKALIHRILSTFKTSRLFYEIIFVDDNSTDGTFEKILNLTKNAKGKPNETIKLYKKIGKKGKSFSLIEGFRKSTGDVIVMIDGDLQYPPEAIPEMIAALESADIVVANRKHYKDSIIRKFLSNTFRTIFGRFLFGINHDVQSGLKVMISEVVDAIKFVPGSAWTFDLEFLHRAKQAGFVIRSIDILFAKREKDISKISFIKTTFEIGVNALIVRTKIIHPIKILPKKEGLMLGAGMVYKRKKYITHTTMPHETTALRTIAPSQKIFLFFVILGLAIGFIFYPLLTLQGMVGLLSFIYFVDVLFNFYLIMKSLNFPQEIRFSNEEIAGLKNSDLPVYTILCPLYKEVRVLHQFIEAMSNLSWPKEKLDVILLLEEDDKATIKAVEEMDLPLFVRKLIVPHSIPKTKPKACNYGLAYAKGEYLVIYDAEDIPDALQLKKAYLGFQKTEKDIICLQAKLNYYNPHQNLLTRLFTAEYSLWFDITLPGLQSINTTIPLGGTSNHFNVANLLEVEGWDPFNVTEDADLGVRLFKKGYKTAMIDSITLEEANSNIWNWLRQRSRWIKGYMQTYFVHIRRGFSVSKNQRTHSLIFQLLIGGKIAFVLINPILWAATIAYFALYAYVGPQIETLYPSVIFYMALFSLVFGNFLFLYYYMIGVAKKGQWNLMKFVFLIPIYWLMISVAAFIALYQLILNPHYWEKTVHGLHLDSKNKKAMAEAVVESEEASAGFAFPRNLKRRWVEVIASKQTYILGIALVLANITANFLNFLYNAYLGRVLKFEDFALIGLFSGFLSFASVLFGAFSTTSNFRTGFLIGRYGDNAGYSFWKYIRRKAFLASFLVGIFWMSLTPLLMGYFHTNNPFLFILFGLVLLVGLAGGVDRGFLSSRLKFGSLAMINIFEPVIKMTIAIILVYLGFKIWAFSAIPVAILCVFFLGWALIRKQIHSGEHKAPENEIKKFSKKFFFASILTGASSVGFLTIDILLAKHYLIPSEAGKYALLSLVGKMVYFLGALVSPFLIPLISRSEGANKKSSHVLYLILLLTILFSLFGYMAFGIFGYFSIPILYGKKALAIVPYVSFFTFGMMAYTVSRVFVSYYLIKRSYTFTLANILLIILQVITIGLFHQNVKAIALGMVFVWWVHLILITVLHLGIKYVKIFENNVADFFGLFARLISPKAQHAEKLRILIFNWRDTKHKWAGGAEVYIHELSKRWVKDGNSVTIFCGNSIKRPKNEKIDGINIIRRGGFYTVYIWAYLYYMFNFRGKFDVIIDSENGIPFFTPLYAKEKKFLLIHHVHQEVFRKSLKPPFSWFALFLEAKLMPFVYRNVQVITVSPSSKEEILKHKLTKTDPIIIYNGVDLEKFVPGEKSKKPIVLYVGRLQYYKSLHIFIKAAKKIIEKIPNLEFIIAGEGGERKKLRKLTKRLMIENKIKFLGRVGEKLKIRLFQNAWVFVNPSFMEGWGITTIEAAACGTPTVASNVPGLRDSIKNPHTGILVRYGDHQSFAENIIELIKNDKLRKEMSKESTKWAKNFTWEKSSKELMKLFKD